MYFILIYEIISYTLNKISMHLIYLISYRLFANRQEGYINIEGNAKRLCNKTKSL